MHVTSSVAGNLKEQCHENFAVLSQSCAKIITLRFQSQTKSS